MTLNKNDFEEKDFWRNGFLNKNEFSKQKIIYLNKNDF